MHELSLCHSIYQIVDRAREGRACTEVHLQVGQLRQVIPETLTYCWGLVTAESELSGSRLVIDQVPVRLRCAECSSNSEIDNALLLACADCGSAAVELETGEEFMVTSIDLVKGA